MDKEQLLYDYFSNDLTPEQEGQLNVLLDTDSDFKERFKFEKDLQRIIHDKEVKGLKSKLRGFEKDISDETTVRTLRPNYRKWSIAASIALLITAGWLGYNSFSGPNYGALYESNFQEYPNTVYAITRGETVESIEREAFAAYEAGNYQAAIDNLNKIDSADKKGYFDFYLGQSYLSLGHIQEAQAFFNKTVTSNSEFSTEAEWYLALISIKEKDKEGAIRKLRELTSKSEFKKDRAQKLLQELE